MSHSPRSTSQQPKCCCFDPHVAHSISNSLSNHRVVAYLRGDCDESIEEQRQLVKQYCDTNGLEIASEFSELGSCPGMAFNKASKALRSADSIIVSDLDRLVTHHDSRWRDLRPLLHEFVCKFGKHLISIREGINTGSAGGQIGAVELMGQYKDSGEVPFLIE